MRSVTNAILFLVALLAVVSLYVFRQESFVGLRNTLTGALNPKRAVAAKQLPVPPKAAPAKPERVIRAARAIPEVDVVVVVPEVKSPPGTDAIAIGMEKSTLAENFGPPEVRTSSREGERLLETYVYLPDATKATVVRLINGRVASVHNTRTVSPPLLVPRVGHPEHVLFQTYSR